MKVEFFKDYNGDIWFYFCRDIHFRQPEGAEGENDIGAKGKA